MKKEFGKYFRFLLGLFIAALGTVFMIEADMGLSPWDVLHQGLALILDMTIGQGNILVSVLVFVMALILGSVVGSGSILATILFGVYVDMIIAMDIVPSPDILALKVALLISGTFVFAYGTYIGICEGLGCGPRDSFMMVVSKKTGYSSGAIRNVMELSALGVGFVMGGHAGVGTLIVAALTGFFLQKIFDYHGFNPADLDQRNLRDEWSTFIKWLRRGKNRPLRTS